VADDSERCVACHSTRSPGIVQQWTHSRQPACENGSVLISPRSHTSALPPKTRGGATSLGASMGATIALVASARLQNPEVRFAVLGPCLSTSVPRLVATEEKGPSGPLLSIREASDDFAGPCTVWKEGPESPSALHVREIVLETGLRHGFLYTPLPEWVKPVMEWSRRQTAR